MDNNKKAKHTLREKPGLKPWFIDHAKALPATTGATALDIEAPVAARPFTEHRSSLPTVLFTNIPVELNAKPVFNFIKRRINNSNGQRTVGLL